MKLYRYKKDGCLYNLYEMRMPYYELKTLYKHLENIQNMKTSYLSGR